ncbi:MAG: hypothetical protein HY286_10240 [Planctomycetes bacterium]|nr:hypothetical protein [Planctomycetota bacterium]
MSIEVHTNDLADQSAEANRLSVRYAQLRATARASSGIVESRPFVMPGPSILQNRGKSVLRTAARGARVGVQHDSEARSIVHPDANQRRTAAAEYFTNIIRRASSHTGAKSNDWNQASLDSTRAIAAADASQDKGAPVATDSTDASRSFDASFADAQDLASELNVNNNAVVAQSMSPESMTPTPIESRDSTEGRAPQLLQTPEELVEFATLHRGLDGRIDFSLGFSKSACRGLEITISSFGNRRVGVRIQSREDRPMQDEEIERFLGSLARLGLDVVEIQ